MLDFNKGAPADREGEIATTERLKANLASAFSVWQAQSPRTNSKAELARLCQKLAGRTCTPQTVGSWFKTGRMDKVWLPVLEHILHAPLGFSGQPSITSGSEPGAPSPEELAGALMLVARAVQKADVVTQASLPPLFAMMADANVESGLIARQLSFLLSRSTSGQQSSETHRPEESDQDFTISVDEDEASDGASDSTEKQERRPRPGGVVRGNGGGRKAR